MWVLNEQSVLLKCSCKGEALSVAKLSSGKDEAETFVDKYEQWYQQAMLASKRVPIKIYL